MIYTLIFSILTLDIGMCRTEEISMGNPIVVALDAMGGDNAPSEIVKGAIEADKRNRQTSACARISYGEGTFAFGGLRR